MARRRKATNFDEKIKVPMIRDTPKNKKCRKRLENKLNLIALKGGKCVVCGYNRCVYALEFHHRDPSTKEFGLDAKSLDWKMERLLAEAEKCDLVCTNCHREIHFLNKGKI